MHVTLEAYISYGTLFPEMNPHGPKQNRLVAE